MDGYSERLKAAWKDERITAANFSINNLDAYILFTYYKMQKQAYKISLGKLEKKIHQMWTCFHHIV